jgi:hypothetical protein
MVRVVQFSSVRRGLRRKGGIQNHLTEDRFAFCLQVSGERIAQAGRDRACPGTLLLSAQGKIDRSSLETAHFGCKFTALVNIDSVMTA